MIKPGVKNFRESLTSVFAWAMWVGAVLLVCAAVQLAHAADTTEQDAEAKQFADEEKAALDQNKVYLMFSDLTGKFTLFTEAEIASLGDPAIVGRFESGTEMFIVKSGDDKIKAALAQVNGQICTVNGKRRNNGKYLYVRKVEAAGAANPPARRRGGL